VFSGRSSARIATRGKSCVEPVSTVSSLAMEPCSAAIPASSRGLAPGYDGPSPPNQSLTPTTAAFTTPTCGSSWNMPRKITPAANMEIAIGMKTMSLNAVLQRIFSIMTAKIRPSTVHMTGATITQMMLFLIAVNVESLENIVKYLSNPTNSDPEASKNDLMTV